MQSSVQRIQLRHDVYDLEQKVTAFLKIKIMCIRSCNEDVVAFYIPTFCIVFRYIDVNVVIQSAIVGILARVLARVLGL